MLVMNNGDRDYLHCVVNDEGNCFDYLKKKEKQHKKYVLFTRNKIGQKMIKQLYILSLAEYV